ncbi:MAG: HipA domain-containing protein [Clostridium sp.]|nr:HipA domain-containing protein [Clostridium sp.]
MRCLFCGEEITEKASEDERRSEWHRKCVRRFFRTDVMPELSVTGEELEKLANDTVMSGVTVPGVQKKISLHLSRQGTGRLTIMDYPAGYILKPETKEFPFLPEYERAVMQMAEAAGIKTVPFGLIRLSDEYAYITRRIDREISDDRVIRYAMEDFCQLSGRITRDKYKGSYEGCGRIIRRYSSQPGLDMSEFFMRIVFCFTTGNSDMHLKNFSLIEKEPGTREYGLSAAYDLLPVNLIMPSDKEETALTLNGKKHNIRRKDLLALAENCGIPEKAAVRMTDSICSKEKVFLKLCETSHIPEPGKKALAELIAERIQRIQR